ncbi:MAG: chemotaxis response regulator protein-glutamate methylesterase [Coleofasciculaceae cyanobacterium]
MRIAIVNDVLMAVEAMRRVLSTVPEYEIVWVAHDGGQAVQKCAQDTPDLILMDLLMPVMDGVEVTRRIMKNFPCAILVVTASVKGNLAKVFEAMGYGALDVVSTPVLGIQGNSEASQALLTKIATIGKLIGKSAPSHPLKPTQAPKGLLPTVKYYVPRLVAIGASTGGPKALGTILSHLPGNLRAAIVIIQHVDAQFSQGLVDWLDKQTPLSVKLAKEGSCLEAGKVVVAGTNDHLVLKSNLTLAYTPEPRNYPYRPSVDAFFKSLAQYWPRKGTAVLLTGMGRDGAEGLGLLRAQGWYTIAQNQETCVVYGMPKAAVQLDAAGQVLPIEAIAPAIIKRLTM